MEASPTQLLTAADAKQPDGYGGMTREIAPWV